VQVKDKKGTCHRAEVRGAGMIFYWMLNTKNLFYGKIEGNNLGVE